MKKNITLFAIMLLFCSASFSQKINTTYYDYQHTKKHEVYTTNIYGIKNGLYTEYSEYGGILTQGTYRNDKQVGKWLSKDDKGKPLSEINYDTSGQLNGQVKYYVDGDESDQTNYKHGIKNGHCKIWFQNADNSVFLNKNLKTQLQYDEYYKDDMLDSIRTEYYPNGNLKEVSNYKNDNVIGEPKLYDEQGQLRIEKHIEGEKIKTYNLTMLSNKAQHSYFNYQNIDGYVSFDTITLYYKLQITYDKNNNMIGVKITDKTDKIDGKIQKWDTVYSPPTSDGYYHINRKGEYASENIQIDTINNFVTFLRPSQSSNGHVIFKITQYNK